jgi:Tol biopolymer transport system component
MNDIVDLGRPASPPVPRQEARRESLPQGWSRDGNWVYFVSARSGGSEVWKAPAGGGEAIQVTRNGGLEAFESPDGKFDYTKE